VGLNRKAEESILGVEREIYKRTSISNTRLRQKNKNGSKYIGLYNGRSIIYEVRKWTIETSSLPLKISQ